MKWSEHLVCAGMLLCGFPASRADYVVSLGSRNSPLQMFTPGQSIALDIILSSDKEDRNNSVILRIEFNTPGLSLVSYQWLPPYGTADGNDDSKPLLNQLPKVLVNDTLSGPGYPRDTVDIELSNVTGVLPGFASGPLVKLILQVPAVYEGPNIVRIRVLPDTIAEGFDTIFTRVEQDFFLVRAPIVYSEPKLEIRVFDGVPLILWPLALKGYALEAAEDLYDPVGWKPVESPVYEVGDWQAVLRASGSNHQYFRLRAQ